MVFCLALTAGLPIVNALPHFVVGFAQWHTAPATAVVLAGNPHHHHRCCRMLLGCWLKQKLAENGRRTVGHQLPAKNKREMVGYQHWQCQHQVVKRSHLGVPNNYPKILLNVQAAGDNGETQVRVSDAECEANNEKHAVLTHLRSSVTSLAFHFVAMLVAPMTSSGTQCDGSPGPLTVGHNLDAAR